LGGGIGMQFVHQHPQYCERLALIASGGLGAEVGLSLRLLASPAAELIAPLIAPKSVVAAGNRLLTRLESVRPPKMATTETWEAYASLSDRPTRQAFLRTLRSVVDYRGQAVSARSRLDVTHGLPVSLLWGEQDPIIPVAHARAAHDALPGSRLLILPGVGHTPQLEAPAAVADSLEAFVNSTAPWTPMATA
ncbi:MAG: alpha/beta fold hydrolase, partial [Mycolicibacterium aromaticivorans]|nr:alpha/beta fold hydrolase [Mycolicibacterium aromaticivorans]